MANWTFKQKSDNAFMSSFSEKVKTYLGIKERFPSGDPARWLLDSFQLFNTKWPNTYGDYSFIVVPGSKALEYWIFKIAKDLGVDIDIKTDKAGIIISQIEKKLEVALNGIEEKLGDSIKIDISYLRNFLKEYRHDIVHCRKKIDSVGLAKNKVVAIYERINSITSKLIEAGLIKIE